MSADPEQAFFADGIVEDVITAGTSVRETMEILAANNNPKVAGVIVSVDRMERGTGSLSAIAEIQQNYDFPVFAIVDVKQIIEYLHNRAIDEKVYIDDDMKVRMKRIWRNTAAKSDN